MAREYKFNAKQETENIINWIKNYFVNEGPECNAVIGISGGKDSSIVAALCAAALGPDRVIGVLMPQGDQHDIDVAARLCEHLGIARLTFNIEDVCNSFYDTLGMVEMPAQVTSNTPARIRMSFLYAVAAVKHGRVACTSNYSENYVGYSTKYGDHAGDFAPIHDYTVTELLAIGEVLHLPNEFIYKTPEDGLSGKTDEDNLGFTYEVLDNYITFGKVPDYDTLKNIEQRHKRNQHKTKTLTIPYSHRRAYRPGINTDWEFEF